MWNWGAPFCQIKFYCLRTKQGANTKVFFSSDKEFPNWYKLYKNLSNENASSVILCHDLILISTILACMELFTAGSGDFFFLFKEIFFEKQYQGLKKSVLYSWNCRKLNRKHAYPVFNFISFISICGLIFFLAFFFIILKFLCS